MIASMRRCVGTPGPVTLNIDRIGSDGGAPPLIILHGLFGHVQNWRSVGRAFASRLDRRIILADLRNHGASPRVPTMTYSEMAEDVIELAKKEGKGGRVDLLGHSMGGKTAMVAATVAPDLFERIIIEDVAPRRYTANTKLFRQYVGGMRTLDLGKARSEMSKLLEPAIPDKAVREFILTNVGTRDGQLYWKVNIDAVAANLENILGSDSLNGQFSRPSLFVHGGNSNYLLPSDHDTILAHFPHAQIESIPGAGHWLHAEKPHEFIASVVKFLTS